MRNDQIFVLLLVVLLPMSGCFDGGGVGEAEGAQDSDSTDDSGTSTGGVPTIPATSNSQDRIWYSSGEIVDSYWNDGQDVSPGSARCLEYGPTYDSSTGTYLGEECKETGIPGNLSDWNASSCIQNGGVLSAGTNLNILTGSAYSPVCRINVKSINTSAGEALLLYQMSGISMSTTCGGVSAGQITQIGGHYGGEEYVIASGSAMSCVHEIYIHQGYVKSSSDYINNQNIWSLVYALQDTVVV